MKKFALIGAAGYIAPRHMKAIRETNNDLIAALDKNDSVGIIDSYFPDAHFFTEFERFDRHVDKLRRKGSGLDYVSICSPNYLHDSHIRFALRANAHAICEKPLVLNPWNVDALLEFEQELDKKIYTILQLRLHPSVIALRQRVQNGPKDKIYDIDLSYITSRGRWYHASWKADLQKSGGVITNIGVHFFDMLMWIFGDVKSTETISNEADHAEGNLQLQRANVHWKLSINGDHLPQQAIDAGRRTHRSLQIEGEEFEFSDGFTDLHTQSYQHILDGNGFGLKEAMASISLVHQLRQ
jgi:UDP-N-acetyl-2-amino-2-deoxyglucuronate dehydrogenase